MFSSTREEPRLPFPTEIVIIQGVEFEEYIIPDDQRRAVLDQLYPFDPVPALDDEFYDLHSGKTFLVREYRVLREGGMNWLVSPYFEEGGGTVIDWVPPEMMEQDEEDWSVSEEEEEDWFLPDADEDQGEWLAREEDYWA
jgi:hypothetical protein